MHHLKHFIDLTQDSDDESLPAAKRQKSYETPEIKQTAPLPNGSVRRATPVGETQQAGKSKKAVTNSDGNAFIPRSPFRNRPSWSKVHITTPNPLNLSTASTGQPNQADGNPSHPRSTPEYQSAKTAQVVERYKAAKVESRTSRPSTPFAAIANKTTSQDGSRHSSHASSEPGGAPSHTPISRSNYTSAMPPRSSPLVERRRTLITPDPAQLRNTAPLAGTPSSQISVVIDNSQRAFTQSGVTEELLSRFIQPLPATSRRPSSRTTIVNPPISKEHRRQLLAQLKQDTSTVHTRASSVEAIFGPHGFSPMYRTDDDIALRKQQAQPKAKKVRRKEVKLDRGSSDHFVPEPFDPKELIPPREQASQILNSKFDDAIVPPITFVNKLNDKQLSGKFQFISSYIRRPGVEAAPPEAKYYGCNCDGECKPGSCRCLVDDREIDDFGDVIDHGKIVPYHRVHTRSGKIMSVLRDDYMKKSYVEGEKSEIIECNRDCWCGADCWNRVVQKGRTLPLEIFMTAKCGFGLRSPQDITRGQFIDLYLGEVITETELESRELATEGAPSYIFSLDWFSAKDVYYVDSLNFGTPTRFMNHSCDPNCRVFTVILNRADERVYGLAFFATRDIPAGKELNIDYNPQEAGKVYPKPTPGEDDGVVLCHCGSSNCRVRLWPGPKRKKGKGWARS